MAQKSSKLERGLEELKVRLSAYQQTLQAAQARNSDVDQLQQAECFSVEEIAAYLNAPGFLARLQSDYAQVQQLLTDSQQEWKRRNSIMRKFHQEKQLSQETVKVWDVNQRKFAKDLEDAAEWLRSHSPQLISR